MRKGNKAMNIYLIPGHINKAKFYIKLILATFLWSDENHNIALQMFSFPVSHANFSL